MEKLKDASFESKTELKIPSGAEITKKDVTVRVREIENGFIIDKSIDIKYTHDGDSHYEYVTKSWYTKENPMDIDLDEPEELADKFD